LSYAQELLLSHSISHTHECLQNASFRNRFPVFFHGISIFSFADGITIVSGILTIIFSLWTIYEERQLAIAKTLREWVNELQSEVDLLKILKESLYKNINALKGNVSTLKIKETCLQDITKQQGIDVEHLVELVKENKRTQDEIKENMRLAAIQDITHFVLEADDDGDFTLDETEVSAVINQLTTLDSIVVDEDRIREAISHKNGCLGDIIDLINNMINEKANEDYIHLVQNDAYIESYKSSRKL